MNIDLTPVGRPSAFSDACAQPGEALFEPVLFNGGSAIIAGGPRLLAVFNAKGGKEWELPCRTAHGIAGFCLFEGIIYVQDGPVLSAWHGLQKTMFAARNLSTGLTWNGEDAELDDDFYDYSEDDADAAAQLLNAHHRHAWASLLADLAPLADEQARTLSRDIRQSFGFSDQDAGLVKADAVASLDNVKKTVARIVFSAPVTRQHRRAGSSGNIVFTLGMNGSVYALDAQLEQVAQVTRGADLPLRPQLVIAEPPADNGARLCRLCYMTISGGITVLDGVSSDLGQQRGWSATHPPKPDQLLPLSYHDGMLMGGGMLGADFFVADIRQPGQLAQTLASPDDGCWSSYQPDPLNKLVVLSNDQASRLFAYGPQVVARDRWGLRPSAAPAHLSVAAVAPGDQPAPWLIETEVGTAGGTQPRWRALYLNTVDPTRHNPLYKPLPAELASGTLTAHTVSKTVAYGWVRSRPLVNDTDIFCVVRTHEPRLLQAGADGGAGAVLYDLPALQQQLERRARPGLLRAGAEAEAPTAGSVRDALVNFDLKIHAPDLRTLADAEYQRMLLRRDPMPAAIVQVIVYKDMGIGINPLQKQSGPTLLTNVSLELELQPGGERLTVTTDDKGLFCLSHLHLGCTVTITRVAPEQMSLLPFTRLGEDYVTCEPFKISDGTPPTIVISYTYKSNSRFPHRG